MKVATVNVIEVVDGSVISVNSFSDDKNGNKEAEKFFTEVAKENGCNEIGACLEDGHFSGDDYYVSIIHSR